MDNTPSKDDVQVRLKRLQVRTWNVWEFIITVMSYSMSLTNFWRFPFMCYQNGGIEFCLVYVIMLIFVARPLYHLDLMLGIFSSRASILMYYNLAPGWTGIGICQCIVSFAIQTYFAYLMSVGMIYFIYSFNPDHLAWTQCLPKWGINCTNTTIVNSQTTKHLDSSTELYLEKEILKRWDIHHGMGVPDWRLVVCLFMTWALCCVVCPTNSRYHSKLAYLFGVGPFIVLMIMLICALRLDHSLDGIKEFLHIDFSEIIKPYLWVSALAQSLYSFGIGTNIIANYSSDHDVHFPVQILGPIIMIFDTVFSVSATLVLYCSLGNMSARLNEEIKQVLIEYRYMMVYVTNTDLLAQFGDFSAVATMIFFFVFYCVGLGNMMSFMQVIQRNVLEVFPNSKQGVTVLVVAIFGFGIGIIYTTRTGITQLEMVDKYATTYIIITLSFLQIIAVFYSYGLLSFCYDLEYIMSEPSYFYTRYLWCFVSPLIIIITVSYAFMDVHKHIPVQNQYIGAGIYFTILLIIPICMICFIIKNRHAGCRQAIKDTFASTNWVPLNEVDIDSYNKLMNFKYGRNDVAVSGNWFEKFVYALTSKA